jgi:hypothetical protein
MSNPRTALIPHGQYIAPHLNDAEQTELSSDETSSDVVRRYKRKEEASSTFSALNCTRAVFTDAIAIGNGASASQYRGGLLLSALMIVAAVVGALYIASVGIQELNFRRALSYYALFMYCIGFVVAAWALRYVKSLIQFDLFGTEDEPIIFDRKHRKVYRLFLAEEQGWRAKLKSPVRLRAAEYDWNLCSAEHRAQYSASANNVQREHQLVLVVRDHPKDKKHQQAGRVIDELYIGPGALHGTATTPLLWEYIRRFMEENGPGLPEGEKLQLFERPTSLWQSMGVVGPFGPRLAWWWRTNSWIVVLSVLGFPVTFPFLMLWAVCNRISHLTMRKTMWPEELHQRLGQPVMSSYQQKPE